MPEVDRFSELLSELQRIHRRLDVVDQQTRMTDARVKRLIQLIEGLDAAPDRRRALRDAALDLLSQPVEVPDDIRKLLGSGE